MQVKVPSYVYYVFTGREGCYVAYYGKRDKETKQHVIEKVRDLGKDVKYVEYMGKKERFIDVDIDEFVIEEA